MAFPSFAKVSLKIQTAFRPFLQMELFMFSSVKAEKKSSKKKPKTNKKKQRRGRFDAVSDETEN